MMTATLPDVSDADKARFKTLWLDQNVTPLEAAQLMGWPRTTARSRAQRMGLPNKVPLTALPSVRAAENLDVIRTMRAAGSPLEVIGKAIGVNRRYIAALLVLHPDIKPLRSPRKAPVAKAAPTDPKGRQSPQATPGNAPMRYDFRAAPVRFIQQDRDLPPIGQRILAELTQRPLSTMTLATVLGEKEAIVGQALSVLRYEAKVSAADGANIRQTVWSVAA